MTAPVKGTIPLPPPRLATESYLELNRTFYGIEPLDYFDVRLALLVAAKPEIVQAAISDGLEYKGLRVGGGHPGDLASAGNDAESDEGDTQTTEFVISESLSLLHHASETLLRFYLAHVGLPPCPWVEIAQERNPDGIKKKVQERFDGRVLDTERRTDLGQVFYGRARPLDEGPAEDVWQASLENIEHWMTHFASWFVSEAHLYTR